MIPEAQVRTADPSDPRQISAPFQGFVTTVVSVGDEVEAGDVIAVIEAMKMEACITAPMSGTVSRVAVSEAGMVDGGDLVLVL